MDLLDIFEKPEPELSAADLAAAIGETFATAIPKDVVLPDHLVQQASAAARAHDSAVAVKVAYDNELDRLQKEVSAKLGALQEQHTRAQEILRETIEGLETAMDAEQVSRIPMEDRPDIVLKTTPGRKKQVTKTWLIDTYGSEEAKKIWDAVPKHPDKRKVVVPDRYQDEPDVG